MRRSNLFPVSSLLGEFDHWIHSAMRDLPRFEGMTPIETGGFPSVNLWHDEHSVHLEAEMPGVALEDLEIHVQGHDLAIAGERRQPEDPNGVFHRRERTFGKFVRKFRLPVAVDHDKVEATLKEGVLYVTMAKSESAKPRKIAVKAG